MLGAFDDGYDRSLWEMHQLGIDLKDTDSLSSEAKITLLVAGALGGLSIFDRFRGWSLDVKARTSQWLKASMAGGMSLPESLTGLDRITGGFINRIVGLASNEIERAAIIGSTEARKPYVSEFVEVWLTRNDPLVCPVCSGLELQVTELQPIDDSHPGCRCRKVLMAVNEQGRPVNYVSFLQGIGRR